MQYGVTLNLNMQYGVTLSLNMQYGVTLSLNMQYGVTLSLNKITQNKNFHFCTFNGPSVGTASDDDVNLVTLEAWHGTYGKCCEYQLTILIIKRTRCTNFSNLFLE